MTDEQLLPMVEAIRGHRSMEVLQLNYNRISNVGCQALATLLQDPSCNLHTLDLHHNHINNDGAIAIINSLANNNKLTNLCMNGNQVDDHAVVNAAFVRLLCNQESINSMHLSNHTLHTLVFPRNRRSPGVLIASLLNLNMGTNKGHIAIKKILRHLPSIDISPLFELSTKKGEQNLKGLLYVVACASVSLRIPGEKVFGSVINYRVF